MKGDDNEKNDNQNPKDDGKKGNNKRSLDEMDPTHSFNPETNSKEISQEIIPKKKVVI
jgi:hypothetical protein